MRKFVLFVWAMVLSYLPGVTGFIYSPRAGASQWYDSLEKSMLTPAPWVFGVVWPILYFLLGVALYLILRDARPTRQKLRAYIPFGINMVLNALWTYWFFGLHMPQLSLYVSMALIIVAIWLMRAFRGINRTAGNLVWPYIGWLVFAMYLNGAIVNLN